MEKDAMFRGKESEEEKAEEKRLALKVKELYNTSNKNGSDGQHRRVQKPQQERVS